MKTKQELINISKGFLLGIITILGFSALAWNGPVSNPPNYNAYAPVNVSLASQTKGGALWAGSFLTAGGGYFGGNVGIGTSNPSASLDVNGNIKGQLVQSTLGGFKFPDGTIQITATANHGLQTFTSNGTFTVPAGVTTVWVTAVGGGGSGSTGSSTTDPSDRGHGGGAGGMAYRTPISVTPGTNIPVTVGTGGVEVNVCTGNSGYMFSGNSGTGSSFGSYITVGGGGAGTISSPGASGGGILSTAGSANNICNLVSVSSEGAVSCVTAGKGGDAFYYKGGYGYSSPGSYTSGGGSASSFGYGGGGSGGTIYNRNSWCYGSGAGAPGIVIVEY